MAEDIRSQLQDIRERMMPTPEPEAPAEEEIVEEEIEAEATLGEEATEPTQEEVAYFNELPEAIGMDPEQFYNLKLKTGTGEELTWSEIKDKLQTIKTQEETLSARAAELEQQQQTFQQAAMATQQQQAPVTEAVQQASNFIQQLDQAYNIKLQQLEQAKQSGDTDDLAKVNAELFEIQAYQNKARADYSTALQQQQQIQHQSAAQFRQTQQKKIEQYIPEFANPDTRKPLQAELRSFLLDNDIQQNEVDTLLDARVLNLFHKAMLYDKHQKDVKDTVTAVRGKTVRRIVKGSHSASATKGLRKAELVDKARNTHREKDKRAAFRAVAREAGLMK